MHPLSAQVLRYAAFTDAGTGGNPAGVVLDSDRLTDQQMLAIAAAIGYSETAFVSADGRRLRFFSPRAEVAFCGHATVATAVALAERDGSRSARSHAKAASASATRSAGASRVDAGGEVKVPLRGAARRRARPPRRCAR
jgi:PhzF family phenazine biosynthesis protein